MASASSPRAIRALVSQMRIVYTELQQQPPESMASSALQHYGRRYAAEIYLAAQQFRDEPDSDAESRAELQRTLWGACIWELCMHVFVVRPSLLTETLLPWWQLHLCDRRLMEEELPAFEMAPSPETRPGYWGAIRRLIARGLPELALRLLKRHAALQSGGGGDEQTLLERLETLLELMPRLVEPNLMQVCVRERNARRSAAPRQP